MCGTAAEYCLSVCLYLSGPEEGALPPASFSYREEQEDDTVTTTAASLRRQSGGGGEERKWRREGETKRKTAGPPDLDLDMVEKEAQDEERQKERGRREQREVRGRRRKEEEEERKMTDRRKTKRNQGEQGRMSRSLPRNAVMYLDTPPALQEAQESTGEMRGKTRENQKEDTSSTHHAKNSGNSATVQKAAFSFLMPINDVSGERQHLSDSESMASFSEISQSAASVTTSVCREDSEWRRAPPSWRQGDVPGPWLEPSPQRLTQVLIGSRLRGQRLQGGLSL